MRYVTIELEWRFEAVTDFMNFSLQDLQKVDSNVDTTWIYGSNIYLDYIRRGKCISLFSWIIIQTCIHVSVVSVLGTDYMSVSVPVVGIFRKPGNFTVRYCMETGMSTELLRKERQTLEMASNQAKARMFNTSLYLLRMLCLQFTSQTFFMTLYQKHVNILPFKAKTVVY